MAKVISAGGEAPKYFTQQLAKPSPPEQASAPEKGDFGPILTQYKHDAQGTIKALTELKDGEAVAALHHPEVGDIDLVWGNEGTKSKDYEDGYGLSKIAAKHPEMLDGLQDFVQSLPVKTKSENRIVLADASGRAVVRLEWDGKQKTWLLTAYLDEVNPAANEGRTGVSKSAETATPAVQGAGSDVSVVQPAAEVKPTQSASSEAKEAGQSEFSNIEKELQSKALDRETPESIGVVMPGGNVKFVSLQDAVDAAKKAIENGTKAVPFQIHNNTGIRLGDTDRVIAELSRPTAQSAQPAAKAAGKIEDIGEKIGGARKDTSTSTGPKRDNAAPWAACRAWPRCLRTPRDSLVVPGHGGTPHWPLTKATESRKWKAVMSGALPPARSAI